MSEKSRTVRTPAEIAQSELDKANQHVERAEKRVERAERELEKAKAELSRVERLRDYAASHPDLPVEPVADEDDVEPDPGVIAD
jgi:uncharacterized protein (DUF3084 family)